RARSAHRGSRTRSGSLAGLRVPAASGLNRRSRAPPGGATTREARVLTKAGANGGTQGSPVSKDGTFDAKTLPRPPDLHGPAVARAVAARHRRLPRELRARRELPDRAEHRLRPAREHVEAVGDKLGDERRLEPDLGARQEHGGLCLPGAPKAEHGRRSAKP